MAGAAAPEAPPAPVAEGTPPEIEVVEWADNPRYTAKAPATPASEAPTPEAAAPAPVVEGETPKASEADKATLPTDWKAKLAAGDAEFLTEFENDPHVKGFIAGRADFLRKQEQAAQAEAQRRELRDTDPAAYAEADRQAEQARQEQDGLQNVVKTAMEQSIAPLADWITKEYPKEVQDAYNQAVKAGTQTTLAEIVKGTHQALLPHELAKAKEEWTKTELPALFKDYLAKRGESEPKLNLDSGSAAPGGLTLEAVHAMTPAQFRKLTATPAGRAEYDAYFNAGLS